MANTERNVWVNVNRFFSYLFMYASLSCSVEIVKCVSIAWTSGALIAHFAIQESFG